MRTPLRPLTRRGLLTGTLGSAALLAAGGALAGCGTKGAKQTEAGLRAASDLSGHREEARLLQLAAVHGRRREGRDASGRPWTRSSRRPASRSPTPRTSTTTTSSSARSRTSSPACQTIDRDIMVLTDWMAARMIRLGWIQKLDKAKLPNVEKNLLPVAAQPAASTRDRSLAVPWQSGLTGIAYNAQGDQGGPDRRRAAHPPRPQGQGDRAVRDARHHGPDAAVQRQRPGQLHRRRSSTPRWRSCKKAVRLRPDPQVHRQRLRARTSPRATSPPASRWSGDVIQLGFENEKIKFVDPEEGLMLWSDNMLVPNKATHKGNAEKLINYYYDPEVAAELAAYVNYICPVQGAQDEMAKIDPELANNPLIFPDDGDAGEGRRSSWPSPRRRRGSTRRKFQQVDRGVSGMADRRGAGRRSSPGQPHQEVRHLHRGGRPQPDHPAGLVLRPARRRPAAARPRRCA